MKHYPTIIVRLSSGHFATKPIHILREGEDIGDRIGVELAVNIEPWDENGILRREIRELAIQIAELEMLEKRLPVCLVFGPTDCVFPREFGPNLRSNAPWRLGEPVLPDTPEYDRVLATALAELCPTSPNIGDRPLLPPKKDIIQ